MNIEEIKKKVDRFKDDWERSRQCCDIEDFSDEVLSLISIIEQAEKHLLNISKLDVEHGKDIKYTMMLSNLVGQALEAIRGIRR